MSRLKTFKNSGPKKSEQFSLIQSQNYTATSGQSSSALSSSSSVPLLNTNNTTIKELNKNHHSVERSTQLAWRPVVKELKRSKRSISRTSSTIRSKKLKNRFSNDVLSKPKNLFKKRSSCTAARLLDHTDYANHLKNIDQLNLNALSMNQKSQYDFNQNLNHNENYNQDYLDQFRYQKNSQATKAHFRDKQISFNSTFSSNDDSLMDKKLDDDVPNDVQCELYSINTIYDFQVPNFETNKFEKIRVKSNTVELNENDCYKCEDKKLKQINYHKNNEHTTEDSNDEIYGLCTSKTSSSIPEINQFIDLCTELETSLVSEEDQFDEYELNRNKSINIQSRQTRLNRISNDVLKVNPRNRSNLKSNLIFKQITPKTDSEHEFNDSEFPQMVISKSIQLNSELESDYLNKSRNSADKLLNDKFIDHKFIGHKLKTNKLINKKLMNDEGQLINDNISSKSHHAICDKHHHAKVYEDKYHHANRSNPVNKLLELFERPYVNDQQKVEVDKVFNSHRKFSFPVESNYLQGLNELNYREKCRNLNFSKSMDEQHGKSEHIHSQFSKHNQSKNSNQFNQLNDSTNHNINQLLFKQKHKQQTTKRAEDTNHQSIMSPKLTANQLESPLNATDKPQQTNFYFHPPYNPQAQATNFQPDMAYYKQQTETQRFLVTFKHYYPEKCKWAFIVLCCVCLIHSLQYMFQIEHLFIIDSSVHFNSSLTLSVFTGALSSCISLFLAPFVISFCQHNSSRLIAFLGSIMCALGLLFTSFATLPGQLLIAYSFFFGVGSSLLRSSSYTILSKYFKRRRILVEMILSFSCYLSYAFLPIVLSFNINTRNWRNGLQIYSILFLICFFVCILMRPASLYHPQRRAILHLKSLQKRSKLKRKQQQSKTETDNLFRLITIKLRGVLKCVDYSPLHSRTIQLLLCSICLISFGIFHPIFVLCPTFYIHHNFSISTLYYLQLTFGLSGCISPILVYALLNKRPIIRFNEKVTNKNLSEQQRSNRPVSKKSKLQDPLFIIKFSSLAISLLQFYLVQLELNEQSILKLLITIGLYAFFYSLLFCSLKVYVVRKVRARSVCLLYSWFELVQSIPLLIGVTISAFLNDTFGIEFGTYFSSISCLIGFLTFFSIDIHRKLNKKHIDNCYSQQKVTTGTQNNNSKLSTIKNNENKQQSQKSADDFKLIKTKNDASVSNLFNRTKSLNATVRLLGNKRKLLFSSNDNDEMVKKFMNCRQEQHPNKYQRINQNLIQRNYSLPQLSVNDFKEEHNLLPFVLTNPTLFNDSPSANARNDENCLFGSKHSLDTLLNKINQASNNFNNQLVNFASLPEFKNLLTNLKYSNINHHLPIKNYTENHQPTVSKQQSKNHFDFSDEKVIYLSKQPNKPLEPSERRNSNISVRKLSQQFDKIRLIENGEKLVEQDTHKETNSSSESLSDAESDLEEINVDCNQIKNDKQVLEDLNELINESLNNDNLDKFFVRCSPSLEDEDCDQLKCIATAKSKPEDDRNLSKDLSKNRNMIAKLELDLIKKEKPTIARLDSEDENLFIGQLICDDYEHLVQSLLNSKQKEKHHQDCVMSKLIQEILKQITIKSLSDEFNPISPCNSPNLIQLQADLNRFDKEFDRRLEKGDKFVNSKRSVDKHLESSSNYFDPSIKLNFLKESLLSSKCVNCDKLID